MITFIKKIIDSIFSFVFVKYENQKTFEDLEFRSHRSVEDQVELKKIS